MNYETADEFRLYNQALAFENTYFQDMTLKKFEGNLSQEFCVNTETGEGFETSDGRLEQMTWSLQIENWTFCVVADGSFGEEVEGRCNFETKTISIVENQKTSESTLLHEMIHAYEFVLREEAFLDYKDIVLIDLYSRLYKKIPGLKKHLQENMHVGNRVHSSLFMLKSIDLDMRMRYELGTVYAYGKVDVFGHC